MAKLRERPRQLLRIGKANKEQLQRWAEGVALANQFGWSIDQMKFKATLERWRLAMQHRKEGRRLLTLAAPPYRATVSRFYYVMYHAMRAVCYLHHGGDDYEAHSELPKHIPANFPNAATWQNTLKNARLTRNAADYDPYPKSQAIWRQSAQTIATDADSLVIEVRTYLRANGCPQA
jgi:uncharacterized protein (UPF0332 family)